MYPGAGLLVVGVHHGEVRAEVWLPDSNSTCKLPSVLGGFRAGFTLDTTTLCGGWGIKGSWLPVGSPAICRLC